MSRYLKETVRCPICGDTLEVNTLLGYTTQGGSRELDGNTGSPEVYDLVQMCPHCGFVTTDFSDRLDYRMPGIIKSPEYREFFEADGLSSDAKKAYLAGLMFEKTDDPGNAGIWYLRAWWALRDGDDPAHSDKAWEKAVETIQQHVAKTADRNASMVLVDLLRQKGEFAVAKDALSVLEDNLGNDITMIRIAAFERGLIAARDTRPHLLSEVMS